MDDLKDQSSIAQSPHSPESAPYHGTTPGTALTQLTPDGFSSNTALNPIAAGQEPPQFALQAISGQSRASKQELTSYHHSAQDPFITSSSTHSTRTNVLKLSPTAAAFTPQGICTPVVRKRDPRESTSRISSDCNYEATQNASSTIQRSLLAAQPASMHGYSIKSQSSSCAVTLKALQEGMCSDFRRTSRYLKLSNLPDSASIEDINDLLKTSRFSNAKAFMVSNLTSDGVFFIRFADIRDAERVYVDLRNHQPKWVVEYAKLPEFAAAVTPKSFLEGSEFEGQILATALCDGPPHSFDTSAVVSLVKDLLQSFGQVFSCDAPIASFPTVAFRAEYYDTEDAKRALGLNGVKVAGLLISVVPFTPHIGKSDHVPVDNSRPVIIGQEEDGLDLGVHNLSLESGRLHHQQGKQSEVMRSLSLATQVPSQHPFEDYMLNLGIPNQHNHFTVAYSPLWGGLGPGVIGQERIEPPFNQANVTCTPSQRRCSPKNRSAADYTSGHHNVVDIDRIRQGLDVRTTIMLRNIPNKIDQAMLKEIVDETSHGQYDFMYLRIDFANNCNVGYAFINFEDPWFIIDFVRARAGRRWNRFNSDKVAEVSYATIQGKDCLVQKFRNSSVMLEHPSFRPKIFHTGDSSVAGKEDVFPGPDNPSKMRRSIENAEHVGLFAPRAGQHFRDEQRRRRSQYDRGTRLAEMEDSFGTGGQQPCTPLSGHRLGNDIDPYRTPVSSGKSYN